MPETVIAATWAAVTSFVGFFMFSPRLTLVGMDCDKGDSVDFVGVMVFLL
jgi:hypothetical protein